MAYKNRVDLYAAQKRHRVRIRQNLLEYLRDRQCVDCKEKDPIVLEFDHTGKEKKFKGVGTLFMGVGLTRIAKM